MNRRDLFKLLLAAPLAALLPKAKPAPPAPKYYVSYTNCAGGSWTFFLDHEPSISEINSLKPPSLSRSRSWTCWFGPVTSFTSPANFATDLMQNHIHFNLIPDMPYTRIA